WQPKLRLAKSDVLDSDQDSCRHADHFSPVFGCSNGKSEVSTQPAAAISFPREEALLTAGLLALTGGYLEAYTWIVHQVFANAQTGNLVFLWVYVTAGEWAKALHYVEPLLAFMLGVIMASCLRYAAPRRAPEISVLIEIA